MASLSSCSVRDRDYQSGSETVDVDTYQALTVCILALVVCKSLFRVNAVRGKVDCLSGGAPMALEIERLFLNAETGAKRCFERTVKSAETQDRKKSGNRPAQSRQKVRFLIGGGLGGFGETGGGRDRDRTCDPLDVNEVLETQYVEIIRIFESVCRVLRGLFTAYRCRALP